jgi:hypothetical protein
MYTDNVVARFCRSDAEGFELRSIGQPRAAVPTLAAPAPPKLRHWWVVGRLDWGATRGISAIDKACAVGHYGVVRLWVFLL